MAAQTITNALNQLPLRHGVKEEAMLRLFLPARVPPCTVGKMRKFFNGALFRYPAKSLRAIITNRKVAGGMVV